MFECAVCGWQPFFSLFNTKGLPPGPPICWSLTHDYFKYLMPSKPWRAKNTVHQIRSGSLTDPVFMAQLSFMLKRTGRKWSWMMQEDRNVKGRILSNSWSRQRTLFWPNTPDFKEETFDSSGFSAEGTLISASTVPHQGFQWRFIAYIFIKC